MVSKDQIQKLIKSQLDVIGAVVKPTENLNKFNMVYGGETYSVHHRHKNERGSLIFHLEPKDLEKMINDSDDNTIPCLAFSVSYQNKDIEKEEIFLFIATVDSIYHHIQNKYNTSIKLGEKTGNFIFKYGSIMDKYLLDESADILTTKLTINKK